MQPECPGDPVHDAVGRIDGAVRILEDHRHVTAVRETPLARAQATEGPALEIDLAFRRLVDAREQAGDRALAAPALADERHDLTFADGEIDVVHGVEALPRQQLPDAKVPRQTDRAK